MVCPECSTENAEGARFCSNCGAQLERRCAYCGSILGLGAKYCQTCGRPVATELDGTVGLERYLPRGMLDKLEAARTSRAMEGERRVVTMLFCDVKGSTAMAETLDPTAGEVLRTLGMKGILTRPPELGGTPYVLCDMDVCYCPRGRGYFEPISRDLVGRLTHWMPTEEHWPDGQATGGRRTSGNVWLAHRLCNQLAYGTGPGHRKRRQQEMARKLEWPDSNPAQHVSHFGNREAAEAWWRTNSPRRAAHPDKVAPLPPDASAD